MVWLWCEPMFTTRCCGLRLLGGAECGVGLYHRWEEGCTGEVRQQSCSQCGTIGHGGGGEQHFACAPADVGNGHRHQSEDDKGDDKAQKLAECGVEGDENPDEKVREEIARQNTQYNGDNDAWQESDACGFHGVFNVLRFLPAKVIIFSLAAAASRRPAGLK